MGQIRTEDQEAKEVGEEVEPWNELRVASYIDPTNRRTFGTERSDVEPSIVIQYQ